MERAPLRPVPSRPAGPVAPAEAVRYVTGELPGLDEAAASALALVALVGRARDEVADLPETPDLAGTALADALFRARKALRRKLHPLPGSGWCERAERLISDRLDDALVDPGPARLEVHLANCSRCVEHERRLGQAHESLILGFEGAHSAAEEEDSEASAEPEAAPEEAAPAVLRAVESPALPGVTETEELPAPEPTAELPEGEETAQIVEGSAEEVPRVEGAARIEEAAAAEALPVEDSARVEKAARPEALPPTAEALQVEDGAPIEALPPGEEPPRVEETAAGEDGRGGQGVPAAPGRGADEPQVAEPPSVAPAPSVPLVRRGPSSSLSTPAAPHPPRVQRAPSPAPEPRPLDELAPSSAPEPRRGASAPSPTVPTTPPQNPPSDPPPSPPSASPSRASSASAPAWTTSAPSPWPQTGSSAAAAWRSDSPRPVLAARTALESENEWSAIGTLVAVLGAAVVIGLLAVLLASGI